MPMARGAPRNAAIAPVWKPETPLIPHVKVWKLSTRPRISLGTLVCNSVLSMVSYIATLAHAAPMSASDKTRDLDKANIIRNTPKPMYPPISTMPFLFISPTAESMSEDSSAPALPAAMR